MYSRLFILFVLILTPAISKSADWQWYSHQFDVMGTRAKVEFQWKNPKQAEELIKAVENEMRRVDRTMSPYIASSELSRLNKDGYQGVVVSKELFELIKRSLYFSKITHGAFDITFSSVGYLYDYRQHKKPTDVQIAKLKDAINYRKLVLDEQSRNVQFMDDRIRVDLGGIGKGHAVDRCIAILQQAGIHNALVNAGGDTRIIGKRADRDWYIGIRHPRNKDKLIANLPLENTSISTSGDYERFFEANGIRYHHIIDPKTGRSARKSQSVTILANDSTTADALSTSVFILGVKDGMALINSMPQVSAILVDQHGKMFLSKDLAPAN